MSKVDDLIDAVGGSVVVVVAAAVVVVAASVVDVGEESGADDSLGVGSDASSADGSVVPATASRSDGVLVDAVDPGSSDDAPVVSVVASSETSSVALFESVASSPVGGGDQCDGEQCAERRSADAVVH